jgi:hypothetical protein
MNNRAYTGVGSRSTPPEVLATIKTIAEFLAKKGYTLRSGGANGADSAFEEGADKGSGKKEVYLPWLNFNDNKSTLLWPQAAWKMAEEIHPAWDKCSVNVRCLHARNCCQVLGYELDSPSEFLICWTENGEEIGGTATAIKLAKKHKIKVFNLGEKGGLTKLRKYCKKNLC